MVASVFLVNWYWCSIKHIERKARCCTTTDEPQTKRTSIVSSRDGLLHRRLVILCSSISLVSMSSVNTISPIKAEEKKEKEDDGNYGIISAVKSIFDPNEKTSTGKMLPKAYVKAAREVVKTLKESLEEDVKDVAKFRRTADAAKEAIREYLYGWRGQKAVVAEELFAPIATQSTFQPQPCSKLKASSRFLGRGESIFTWASRIFGSLLSGGGNDAGTALLREGSEEEEGGMGV